MNRTRTALVSLTLALPLGLAACGSSTDSAGSTSSSTSMSSSSTTPMETTTTDDMSGGMTKPFGAACAKVPATGAGSFDGMSTAPVATAASANPLLSTLVTAVTAAGLGDTLNTQKAITVFAPTNDAFAAMDQATLKKALADPKGLLTTVLTGHVVAGRLTPEQLAGAHKTLSGSTINVTGSGEEFAVGDAKVICGNVQTANATVYIVDHVILPAS